MNSVALLAALTLLWTTSYALYADRAGEVDWYQRYVGHVTWMRFEQVPGSRRKVLVANRNTVAAFSASSGSLAWRHGLSGIQAVIHNKNTLITVSQSDTVMLHSWEADSGLMRWSAPTHLAYNDKRPIALDNQWRPSGVSAVLGGAKQELALVATGDKLAAFYTRSGKPAWSVDLPLGAEAASLTSSGTTAELLYTASNRLFLTKYDTTAKGSVIDSYSVTASKDVESCVSISSNVVCIVSERVIMYPLDSSSHEGIELKGWFVPAGSPVILAPGAVQGQLRVGNNLIEMVDDGTVNLLCEDCTDEVGIGERQESVRVRVKKRDDELLVKYWDETERLGSDDIVVSLPAGIQGHIERVAVFPFRKTDGTRGLRCLIVLSDSSLLMVSQNGQVVWIKEESLASVLAVELFDLPTASNAETAEIIDTLLHSKGNPLYLAALRAKMQLTTASQFLQSLLDKGVSSLVQESSHEEMLRDQFNLRKIIVVATGAGKLFGLDSKEGTVVWRTHVPDLNPFASGKLLLYPLRSSSHPPHSPIVAVLGTSPNVCNSSIVAYLNPLTGGLEGKPVCLPYHVSQTTLIPLTDSTHQRVLLVLDDSGIPHCIPSSCDALVHSNTSSSLFMFIAHLSTGTLKGMEVVGKGKLRSVEVWRTVFPVAKEKILYVATKNNEIVGSLGRPRSDRSVQYKYLNPHMLAVITQSLEQTKSGLTLYLIDGVTGAIIYQTVHKHSSGPVGVVISENWVVYNYYNVVSRRNEIAVLELYDVRNHTEPEWSSSSPAVLPVVTSQSYTIPTSLRFLSSTITLRSITPKSLLLGLHSGHIAMLRKDLLDPRRNMTPTPDMMEDGLPEYVPVIPLPPQLYINYNQTIEDIAGIYSASTGLESTSLVFAYGRDIFFTQVTPFKQYDLLAESFEKWLIAAVCGGLVFGSIILSQLASRRMLKLLWK